MIDDALSILNSFSSLRLTEMEQTLILRAPSDVAAVLREACRGLRNVPLSLTLDGECFFVFVLSARISSAS